jgi:hypothetical protein
MKNGLSAIKYQLPKAGSKKSLLLMTCEKPSPSAVIK